MLYRSGDRLCNCTLLQKCGSGAYGEVWLAEDTIGTRVALKILANRNKCSERELAGLKNYKECNHPNLLKIRYVEINEEHICYTMDAADDLNREQGEYLPDTLANRLERSGRQEGREITTMLDGLLAGLEELHRRHLVHRDIKPDNILWVNGRPTLADVGLIAPDGQGSLVGTPGFLSPKLMAGGCTADASDDFYALGKVIYCALTGLPVQEYPALPADLTISIDAGLNWALRESCTHPVYSTAEFRRLLRETREKKRESESSPQHKNKTHAFLEGKAIVDVVFLLLFLGGFWMGFDLWSRQKKMEQRLSIERISSGAPQDTFEGTSVATTGGRARTKRMEHLEFQKEIQTPVPLSASATEFPMTGNTPMEQSESVLENQTYGPFVPPKLQKLVEEQFRESGFFSDKGRLAPEILKFQPMTGNAIRKLILQDTRTPRLRPIADALPDRGKTPSALEVALADLFKISYIDFDPQILKQRQQYWQNISGTNEEKQNQMLMQDPIMQAVALDRLIYNGVNTLLREGSEKSPAMQKLVQQMTLRDDLLAIMRAGTIRRDQL